MGRTIAEKILGMHSRRKATAGDLVLANVDLAFFHDASRPHPIEIFYEMGGTAVFDPHKVIAILDHYPSPTDIVARQHGTIRQFALEQGLRLYDLGHGISHTVLPEMGHVLPGQLVIGGDSHSCSHGALNAFATGFGSTDLAAALITGKQWFRVPESMKIILHGQLPDGVYAKDLILFLVGQIGSGGATYQSIEFVGDALRWLSMEARFTISNMAVEMGAKAGVMEADEITLEWLSGRTPALPDPVFADPQAAYIRTLEFEVSDLAPQIATPHKVDQVVSVEELEGLPIDQGILGTCNAARLEDFHVAARIIRRQRVCDRARLFMVPSSKSVLLSIIADGTLRVLLDAGAVLGVPGCSGCMGGASFAVPANGQNVISTANRNFKGRLGNPQASIYLASPATVAASVLEGRIADPRRYLQEG